MNYFVIQCCDYYIKKGGFTNDLNKAKKYQSKEEAKKDRVYPWKIIEVRDD